MFCATCGQPVQRGDKFCTRCGTPTRPEQFEPIPVASSSTAAAAPQIARVVSTTELQQPIPIPKSLEHIPAQEPSSVAARTAQVVPADVPEPPGLTEAAVPAAAPLQSAPVEEPRKKSTQEPHELNLPVPQAGAAKPADPAPAGQAQAASQPEEELYDSCGMELRSDAAAMDLGRADIPTPSFGGYATPSGPRAPVAPPSESRETKVAVKPAPTVAVASKKPAVSADVPRRKSRLPVLEILVVVLLVIGAGAAVWMLRSSLPGTASTSNVNVTISPASAQVAAGNASDFTATVTGSENGEVVWTIEEGDSGGRVVNRGAKADSRGLSSLVVYIAPHTPGTYHLLATSKADRKKSASAEIVVTSR